MSLRADRRQFLKTAAVGVPLLGLGDLGFLSRLRPVSADEARLDPKVVRLQPEIEPLVRLLEETPRERLLEEVAARMRQGLSYREVLAALLLAGVRNVQPRPSVGFKFHAVLVVNSAHLASLASPDTDRWLPIFWALDYFKDSQAHDVREGNWTMGPGGRGGRAAGAQGPRGVHRRDGPAGTSRRPMRPSPAWPASAGANEIYELFFRYGARDFRASATRRSTSPTACRTLQCIGWQHCRAGPAVAGLCPAQPRGRQPRPGAICAPDRPWRHNLERARTIRDDWQGGQAGPCGRGRPARDAPHRAPTTRPATRSSSCSTAASAPQSIWDALFDGAGELLLRQPGIVSLHAVTSTNALHYAYQASGNDETRRLLLLQNAAFLPLFREAMGGRGKVGDARIDQLEPLSRAAANGTAAIEEIFAEVGRDRTPAARKALAYLQADRSPGP